MGVYNTKEWLMSHWDETLEWMSKIDGISEREAISFYRYLQQHGMFAPSKRTRSTFEGLVQKKAWKEMERLFLNINSFGMVPISAFICFLFNLIFPFLETDRTNRVWL